MVLSNWKFGNFFSVNFGWGMGVTMGCYWAGGISGIQIHKLMVNLLCMVKDISYSEEDLNFILTSTIGNNLASKKKKKISTYSGSTSNVQS